MLSHLELDSDFSQCKERSAATNTVRQSSMKLLVGKTFPGEKISFLICHAECVAANKRPCLCPGCSLCCADLRQINLEHSNSVSALPLREEKSSPTVGAIYRSRQILTTSSFQKGPLNSCRLTVTTKNICAAIRTQTGEPYINACDGPAAKRLFMHLNRSIIIMADMSYLRIPLFCQSVNSSSCH